MNYINGVPEITVSLTNETDWVLYKDGYIEYGSFGEDGSTGERLSHWVHWGNESYPTTEMEVVEVMSRVIEGEEL